MSVLNNEKLEHFTGITAELFMRNRTWQLIRRDRARENVTKLFPRE